MSSSDKRYLDKESKLVVYSKLIGLPQDQRTPS